MATITVSISFQKDDPAQAELLEWLKDQPMAFSPALRAAAIIGMQVQKNGAPQRSSTDIGAIVRRELQAMESRLSLAAGGSKGEAAAGDEIDDDLRDSLLAF